MLAKTAEDGPQKGSYTTEGKSDYKSFSSLARFDYQAGRIKYAYVNCVSSQLTLL